MSDGMHYIVNSQGLEELYDLASDPSAIRDVAGTPEHMAVLERFRSRVAVLRQESSRLATPANGR
jgi:hypothetical protein